LYYFTFPPAVYEGSPHPPTPSSLAFVVGGVLDDSRSNRRRNLSVVLKFLTNESFYISICWWLCNHMYIPKYTEPYIKRWFFVYVKNSLKIIQGLCHSLGEIEATLIIIAAWSSKSCSGWEITTKALENKALIKDV
jgi:hypothetical protein